MTTEVEQRAEQVRQILSNPMFKGTFYALQIEVIEDIKATDITDHDRRDYLGLKLKVIEEFRDELLAAIEDLRISGKPKEFKEPYI